MPSKSLADSKITRLQADSGSTLANLADLEWNFYSPQSGLTPASKFSITDHKLAYYKLQGSFAGSIRDVETAYFKTQGAVGGSYDDIRFDFYTNKAFFLPSTLANLELWLEADNISGAVLASDSFDRSKNLMAGLDPSFETAVSGGWAVTFNPGNAVNTFVRSTAQAHSGTASALLTITTGAVGQLNVSASNVNASSVKPGDIRTGSVYVYPSAARSLSITLSWLDSNKGYLTGSTVTYANLTVNTWNRLVTTGTAPANAAFVLIEVVLNTSTTTGDTFYFDDWQLELGSKATPFVWGDATHLGTTDQGQTWVAAGGGTGGLSGATALLGAGNDGLVIDVGTTDVDITTDHTYQDDTHTNKGILARYVDGSNRIYLSSFAGSSWQVVQIVGGTSTTLLTGGPIPTPGTTYQLRLTTVGNSVTAYINGTSIGSGVTTQLTGTKVGLKGSSSTGGAFDNFSVKTPIYSDGAALPIWPDKSGYGRHALQATAAKQPKWRTSNPNLLPYNAATIEVDATAWQSGGVATTLSRDTAVKADGAASLKAVVTGAGPGNLQLNTLQGGSAATASAPVNPGNSYVATVVIQSSIARSGSIGIMWLDAAGNFLGSSATTGITTTTGTVRYTDATARVAPVNAQFAAPLVVLFNSVATDTHNLDSAGIFKDAVPAGGWLPPVTLPNSKPAVQFDGADDNFVTSAINNTTGDADVTMYIVLKGDGLSTTSTVAAAIGSNSATRSAPHIGANNTSRLFGSGADDLVVAGQTPNNSWNSAGYHHTAGDTTLRGIIDGSVNTRVLGGPLAIVSPTVYVGSYVGGANWAGSLAAVVVFSRALSTTERQQVERYLRNKYALP